MVDDLIDALREKRFVFLALIFAFFCVGYVFWTDREQTHPFGKVVAPNEPYQEMLKDAEAFAFWKNGKYVLRPLADFSLKARVILKEGYFADRESDLAKYDLLFAWGEMSDSLVLAELSFSQGGRFGFFNWKGEPPLPPSRISALMSNMHLIPGSRFVESKIASLRKGQVVKLKGFLVEVVATDGWRWMSSLSRTDTGRGACEVFYVESISVE